MARLVRYGSVGMRLIEAGPTLTVTPDGKSVVAVSERPFAARVLQVFTSEAGGSPFATAIRSMGPQIGPFALVPGGLAPDSLVTALRDAPHRLVWFGLPDLEVMREVELQGPVVALAVAPLQVGTSPGRLVVGLAGGEIVRVDVDGRLTVIARTARPTQIAFAPAGDRVAVGTVSGLVEVVWVAEHRVLVTLRGGRSPVAQVRFTPDETRVVASTSATVFSWPSRGGNAVVVERGKQFVGLLGFTPNGALLTASAEERVASHDVSTGKLRWQLEAYGPALYDGKRLISARFEAIRELDPETGEEGRVVHAPAFVDCLAMVPGSDHLIVALSTGSELRVLDLSTEAWSGGAGGHEGEVVNVRFYDGWIVSGGRDTRACVWEAGRSTPVVTAVAPSGDPNDRSLASFLDLRRRVVWVGVGARVVRFRLEDGACQAESELLGGPVTAVFAVPYSTLVVACTGSAPGKVPLVHLLDAPTAQPVHSERLDVAMNRMRLRGDGTLELLGPYGNAIFDPHRPALISSTLDPLRARLGEAHRSNQGDRRVEVANWPKPGGGKRGVVWVTELPASWTLLAGFVMDELTGRASLSASGRYLAVAQADGHVRVIDLDTATIIGDHDMNTRIASVWFFPDESRLMVSTPEGQLIEVQPDPGALLSGTTRFDFLG